MTSPELTGGAGFTYEDAVTAHYLLGMIGGTTAAALDGRIVQRVAQQQADFGEPLDDVIVDAASLADATMMRLSLQVKRSLTISDARSNSDFREVIQRSWQTLEKLTFREHFDRVGAVTGAVAEDAFRALTTVCEWARASNTTEVFMQRFVEGGNASAGHHAVIDAVRAVATGNATLLCDTQLHRLLSHLILIRFDFLHAGSTHEADAIANASRALSAEEATRSGDFWNLLRQFARDGAGRSAVHTRASMMYVLRGWRFAGAPAFAGDILLLRESTRHWLDQQAGDIGGTHLPRQALRGRLRDQMTAHRLTLIKGLPGAGKTVLLRDLVEEMAANGTTLFLTANRLSGRSWAEYARLMGLRTTAIEPLLVDVAATGHAMIFIDGLDRVAPEQRAIITDLFGQLLTNPALSDWRVIATVRDTGIEPLRNWVPPALLANGGVGYVDVENLTNEEASSLADSLPALQPLLTGGDERVRALARRPFFAAVLARGFSMAAYPSDFAPQSEVDLVEAWWRRGGYDASAPQALARQRGLIELAKYGAPDLGRNMRIRELSTPTCDVLPALEEDGVVQQVRAGHTTQFSHDIFFEWSFLHLLLDEGDLWIKTLIATGEPPALARVVELLSQANYSLGEQWSRELHALEAAQLRPQWLRAWLVAPVFSPRFAEHATKFAASVAANEHRLFGKLLVWMQAEKTTPNPMVLSGVLGSDLDAAARIRLADAIGWPSDFSAWRRMLVWAIEKIESIPERQLPDLVTLFGTWQMATADCANEVSQRIISQCATWLHAIEEEHADRRYWRSGQQGDAAPRPRPPANLGTELRAMLLRAARAYPDVVKAYLTKVEAIEHWSDSAYIELMTYAPLLAQTHPMHLSRIAKNWFLAELPDDSMLRWRREASEGRRRREEAAAIQPENRTRWDELELSSTSFMHHSFSYNDWERLSIGASHNGFFPTSPLREPFHSLFAYDPETALALVRDVTNHATAAWRQLHEHAHGRLTPLPLVLEFPWGEQQFWGDDRHYFWFRGHGGPQVVECALMALERWAITKLDGGQRLDELVRKLLQGHTSIGVLGIAVHLALRAKLVSSTTLALLGSMRLWRLDIRRMVQEQQFRSAAMFGFEKGSVDAVHRKAVAESGAMTSRQLELRDLVPYFVLGSDAAFREACRAALDAFPNNLQFAYQEEHQSPEHVAELRHKAELWSEFGRAENYSATPIAGGGGLVQVSMNSAKHEAPEIKASRQQHVHASREAELWLWVDKCFSSNYLVPGFTVAEAVARAEEIAAGTSTAVGEPPMYESGLSDGTIAGAAAAVICFAKATEHTRWADDTINRLSVMQDERSDEVFSGSVIPWHPKIFVAHALAARVTSGRELPTDRETLYRLIAHPLDVVSSAALAGVASCWERDARFAWCGLNLGLRLAQLENRHDVYRLDEQAREKLDSDRRTKALMAAIEEFRDDGPLPEWVRPRDTWQLVELLANDAPIDPLDDDYEKEDVREPWQKTGQLWHGRLAARVLQRVPIKMIMSGEALRLYVDALETFVRWTLHTINPAADNHKGRGRERSDGNLYEWKEHLARAIAAISPYLSANEVLQRLLEPILLQPDDIAMRLLAPYTEALVCIEILDAPVLRDDSLRLLEAVLERTLENRDMRRSPYNNGRMAGKDLPNLIESLLFVTVEHAGRAARFANGCWDDLGKVMPLIDRMVRNVGWHYYVMRQFLTLCERCGGAYSAATFADQMLTHIVDGNFPKDWKGTTLPAKIAALVQAHADRLHPLPADLARRLLQLLDALVDLGDRRSAALQQSESFRGVRFR